MKTNLMTDSAKDILVVENLKTSFGVRGGFLGHKRYVRAVDGVSFSLRPGQTLGLVGESGSGKTTVGRTILRLIPHTAGRVIFDGHDVLAMDESNLRPLRRRMQIIFQDPVGSLNPRMTIGDIIAEPLAIHKILPRRQRRQRVGQLLERVGLSASYAARYPHEFSGGQRQRIGIARALASGPDFIVCDEPVSALDVSIQAQILNLLSDLQEEMGLSYLFIAHNLAVVEHFADEVAVMYLGHIVETARAGDLYAQPTHPYTQSLLASVPNPDPAARTTLAQLPGETPSPINPPPGCAFHPRCPLTRQLGLSLPANETVEIISDAQSVRVAKRCVMQRPELQARANDATHLHACLMRQ
jgi:oligopeptide transport system ATP-binding protein